jgi:hypothetical protein
MNWQMILMLVLAAIFIFVPRMVFWLWRRSRPIQGTMAAHAFEGKANRIAFAASALIFAAIGVYVLVTAEVAVRSFRFESWGAYAVGAFLLSLGAFVFSMAWAESNSLDNWPPGPKLILICASLGSIGSVIAIIVYYVMHGHG